MMGFLFGDPLVPDFPDPDLVFREVDGLAAFRRRGRLARLGADALRDPFEGLLVLHRLGIALGDDVIHARGVEGQHRVALQLVLEQDVRILPVGFADVDGHQGDSAG